MTPTHNRILSMLADGLPHTKQELQRCLWDDMADPNTIRYHISTLRKILRVKSEDILCSQNGVTTYRHIRLMHSEYQ